MQTDRFLTAISSILPFVLGLCLTSGGARAQLSAGGNETWSQGLDDILGEADSRALFGSALAVGDFNGDGSPDLAIGIPDQDVGALNRSGAVSVIYSVVAGLAAPGNQRWTKDSDGIPGQPIGTDEFGAALAAGNFNNDDYGDLAIGIPGESAGAPLAGAVLILFGSEDGLTSDDSEVWSQQDLQSDPKGGENFGASLAVGDFDGDGVDDLAVGVPNDDADSENTFGAGAVNVLYGSDQGLTVSGNQLWHQNINGISGTSDRNDRLGTGLAAGDFNGDGFDDLAAGVPNETVDGEFEAGALNVIYGTSDGLSAEGDQFWTQESEDISDGASEGDHFGGTLAVGDFDNDGFKDLVIGVPQESIGGDSEAGAINVIYGSMEGLASAGNQLWHRDISGVDESADDDENFAAALSVADFDSDGFDDLAIGVPFSNEEDADAAGSINVLYGRSGGLSTTGDQVWSQNSDDIIDESETDDNFGIALASGDFNQDGLNDLAIGVSGQDVNSRNRAGAVHVLYGASDGVSAKGIIGAGDLLVGPVAPGEIITIFAPDVGPSSPVGGTGARVENGRVTTSLAGTQVLFDGAPGALFFVGENQVNVQVSYVVEDLDRVAVQIVRNGQPKNPTPVLLPVQPAVPGLFMVPGEEPQVIAVHFDDGSLNAATNRAEVGEILILYATGEGQTIPPGLDGWLAQPPLPQPVLPVQVKIGDEVIEPDFVGAAPGFAGLLQINLTLPSGVPDGRSVPVRLCVGDFESQGGATIAIQ